MKIHVAINSTGPPMQPKRLSNFAATENPNSNKVAPAKVNYG